MTYPILLHLFNGPATGTPDSPLGFAPSSKAPNVCLVSASKLIAPPDDIVARILRVFLPDLDQMADFTAPLGQIGYKAYIMNATIALII